jgi:RNA polymerase sigma-70 factor (ECF subfamily)
MDLEREKELVFRAKTDADAFGLLYDEYYPKVFGYILRRTASVETAKDITSEVFLKALQTIKRFQWRNISFSAYLYRIAGHEINNGYRRNKQLNLIMKDPIISGIITDVSVNDEIALFEADIQRHEEYILLHKCIVKLPNIYQEIIVLRYFEKKSPGEICQILGKREGTVKSLLHRGLQKLKILMENNATF